MAPKAMAVHTGAPELSDLRARLSKVNQAASCDAVAIAKVNDQ